MHNVGRIKYMVSYHNGIKKNKDGSDFFDVHICKNKKELESFTNSLLNDGYNQPPENELFKNGNIVLYPESIKKLENSKWDNIEISPVKDDGNGNVEVCEKKEATYWSLYLHDVTGGVICVSDCKTQEDAEKLREFLRLSVLTIQIQNYLK